jgi:hypothetical protein
MSAESVRRAFLMSQWPAIAGPTFGCRVKDVGGKRRDVAGSAQN